MAKKKKKFDTSSLRTEKDVDAFINSHKDWWHIALLSHFNDYVSSMSGKESLKLYFAKQVGNLRNKLKLQRLEEDVQEAARKRLKRKYSEENSKQLGDIYGDPKFYRFGDCGNSRKKRKATNFMKGE